MLVRKTINNTRKKKTYEFFFFGCNLLIMFVCYAFFFVKINVSIVFPSLRLCQKCALKIENRLFCYFLFFLFLFILMYLLLYVEFVTKYNKFWGPMPVFFFVAILFFWNVKNISQSIKSKVKWPKDKNNSYLHMLCWD